MVVVKQSNKRFMIDSVLMSKDDDIVSSGMGILMTILINSNVKHNSVSGILCYMLRCHEQTCGSVNSLN